MCCFFEGSYLLTCACSEIKEATSTYRQSSAQARTIESRIACAEDSSLRAECGSSWRRWQFGGSQRGWRGKRRLDQSHEGQEEEGDQGGQLLEGDGLKQPAKHN